MNVKLSYYVNKGDRSASMKLDRLISILVVLLRKERVQAKELAEMFGVSVRTILRDVDAINLAGIPIVTQQGVKGGIGIAEGYRLDRSLLTSDDMAAIITTLKGIAGTITDNRHEILLEKLKNTLSSTQLQALTAKTNQLVIDLSPWGGNEQQKNKIAALRKAIESCREIEFLYTGADGMKTKRTAEPYTLVLKGQKWYLYAWCLLRQSFRLFKLSRMKELVILETSYQPREVAPDQLPWEREWQQAANMVELELLFEKELESIVEEWFGEEALRCEDGRIMVRAQFPENNWLYGFLLNFGTGVEVLNPPHLRKTLAEIAAGIHQKYLN